MDILVVGNGGREHAICTALKKSDKCGKIYCAKGNAGIGEIASLVDIDPCDIEGICDFVDKNQNIALTVVAPDDPLALGLVDELQKRGHRAFGPNKAAAIIEASKAFSKDMMKKYGIPTAKYETFDSFESALCYAKEQKYPLVVKADGLALGKGVIICQNFDEAKKALDDMFNVGVFGKAGSKVVIEEFLTGKEVSVLSFCDSKTIYPMVASCDHKRANDNDEGLNTGGMGTIAPSPFYTNQIAKEVEEKIMLPTMRAMNDLGRPFKGVLYFGLIVTDDGVKVIEYNARFGDPETQVVLPLLKTDLLEVFEAVIDERLSDIEIEWSDKCAVCVMLASGGYPEKYEKGKEITIGALPENVTLYHSGTKMNDGKLVTNGGRVIGVTAVCDSLKEAKQLSYKAIESISFDKMHFRHDIGDKFIK